MPPPPSGELSAGVAAAAFDDPYFVYQWHLEAIRLPEAWTLQADLARPAHPVVVAVLDSGVLPDHPDLAGRTAWVDGWDFVDGDSDPTDEGGQIAFASSWHGTHVTGTIGAITNNGVGITGVVPEDVYLMPLRVLAEDGGTTSTLAEGLLYALQADNASGTIPDHRADVINLSLGGQFDDPLVTDILGDATRQGIVVVAATGNDGATSVSYPARIDATLGVGALDLSGTMAPYSNSGSGLEVFAPGGDTAADLNGDTVPDGIVSLVRGTRFTEPYAAYQGTSMATPHMAGIVALAALAGEPNLAAVRALIADSASATVTVDATSQIVPVVDAAELLYRWVNYGDYYRAVGGLGGSAVPLDGATAAGSGADLGASAAAQAVRSAELLPDGAGTGRFIIVADPRRSIDRTAFAALVRDAARDHFPAAEIAMSGGRFGALDTGLDRDALRGRVADLETLVRRLAQSEGVLHVYEERRYRPR